MKNIANFFFIYFYFLNLALMDIKGGAQVRKKSGKREKRGKEVKSSNLKHEGGSICGRLAVGVDCAAAALREDK